MTMPGDETYESGTTLVITVSLRIEHALTIDIPLAILAKPSSTRSTTVKSLKPVLLLVTADCIGFFPYKQLFV